MHHYFLLVVLLNQSLHYIIKGLVLILFYYYLLLYYHMLKNGTKYWCVPKMIVRLSWVYPYTYCIIIHCPYTNWNIMYWSFFHSYSGSSIIYCCHVSWHRHTGKCEITDLVFVHSRTI